MSDHRHRKPGWKVICWILSHLGVAWLFRLLNRNKLLVLCYHGIASDQSGLDYRYPSEGEFLWQLRFLSSRYRLIPLAKAAALLRAGTPLPPRSACLTFDDGLANNHARALPALRQVGGCATVFLVTGHMDSGALLWPEELFLLLHQTRETVLDLSEHGLEWFPLSSAEERARAFERLCRRFAWSPIDGVETVMESVRAALHCDPLDSPDIADFELLSWDQVEEMHACGVFDVGAHTVRHENLGLLSEHEARREISDSVAAVQRRLGIDDIGFAYPYGSFDECSRRLLQELNVACAVSTKQGLHARGDDLLLMKRISVQSHMSRDYFALATAGFVEAARTSVRVVARAVSTFRWHPPTRRSVGS